MMSVVVIVKVTPKKKNWSKIFVAFVVVVLKFNTENQPVVAS